MEFSLEEQIEEPSLNEEKQHIFVLDPSKTQKLREFLSKILSIRNLLRKVKSVSEIQNTLSQKIVEETRKSFGIIFQNHFSRRLLKEYKSEFQELEEKFSFLSENLPQYLRAKKKAEEILSFLLMNPQLFDSLSSLDLPHFYSELKNAHRTEEENSAELSSGQNTPTILNKLLESKRDSNFLVESKAYIIKEIDELRESLVLMEWIERKLNEILVIQVVLSNFILSSNSL
jgi:hypothetical protein